MVTLSGNRLSAKLDPSPLLARLTAWCGELKRAVEETGSTRGPMIDHLAMAIATECRLFDQAEIRPEQSAELLAKVRDLKAGLPALESVNAAELASSFNTLIASLESKGQANPAEPEKGSEQ